MKRKGKTARFKLQRRLLTELPGLGKAGALERKPYPPGQHGAQRIKYSDYRLQLEEKQKLRFHYGLKEEQLIRFVKLAKKTSSSGKWCEKLVNILERRIDNFIFRAGIAPSIPAAAQFISHGKIFVNGKKVNIRSYLLKQGDTVTIKADLIENQAYLKAKASPRLPRPDWITLEGADADSKYKLADEPNLESVPFSFDDSYVTSYYSKV